MVGGESSREPRLFRAFRSLWANLRSWNYLLFVVSALMVGVGFPVSTMGIVEACTPANPGHEADEACIQRSAPAWAFVTLAFVIIALASFAFLAAGIADTMWRSRARAIRRGLLERRVPYGAANAREAEKVRAAWRDILELRCDEVERAAAGAASLLWALPLTLVALSAFVTVGLALATLATKPAEGIVPTAATLPVLVLVFPLTIHAWRSLVPLRDAAVRDLDQRVREAWALESAIVEGETSVARPAPPPSTVVGSA